MTSYPLLGEKRWNLLFIKQIHYFLFINVPNTTPKQSPKLMPKERLSKIIPYTTPIHNPIDIPKPLN